MHSIFQRKISKRVRLQGFYRLVAKFLEKTQNQGDSATKFVSSKNRATFQETFETAELFRKQTVTIT
jgi:hypothetical protein